jgi:hypothetical protein
MANKIGDFEFPAFSEGDRMKETLDEALPRAVKNQKKPM